MNEHAMDEILKKALADLGNAVQQGSGSLPHDKKIWLAGYAAGAEAVARQFAVALGAPGAVAVASAGHAASGDGVTVLFASHSGNGKSYAKEVRAKLEAIGHKVRLADMASYKAREIKNEKKLVVIISTHGEGVPPPAAEDLVTLLNSDRAPVLKGLQYTVLALGDKSYVHFCKAGVDLDVRLQELGATSVAERVDCDVDFRDAADRWLESVLTAFKNTGSSGAAMAPSISSPAVVGEAVKGRSAKDPFMATVLSKVNLNGRGSEKETFHIELSLEGSGLTYQPGDACGLISRNDPKLVSALLAHLDLDGHAVIEGRDGKSLSELLAEHELTVLNPDVLKKHNAFAKSDRLKDIIEDVARLREYLYGRDLIDLLREYPVKYTAAELLSIVRPMPARLYSIASSPSTYPDEVHLLVSAVRYNALGRNKEGVASTFWADRITEGAQVPVYIRANESYRLPSDPNASVIMVGPGTGVAPFRAFVEERAALGHTGRNWLFFGNPHFTTDFLYQTEWQSHLQEGKLTRMDVAFSRDQQDKIYVQHKILKQAKELYSWISEGAFLYVCGDIKRMAPDVNNAFVSIFETEGGLDHDKAVEAVKALKKTGRYLEDVY